MTPFRGALVVLACAAFSCARANTTPSLAATLHEAEIALQSGDDAALYRLLSAEDQAKIPFALFHQRREAEREELVRFGHALAAKGATLAISSTVATKDGVPVVVRDEPGGVHIDPSEIAPFVAKTPRQALLYLRQALRAVKRSQLVALFADPLRDSALHDIEVALESLRDVDAVPVLVHGGHAVATLAEGHEVRFVLADGVWKIEALE